MKYLTHSPPLCFPYDSESPLSWNHCCLSEQGLLCRAPLSGEAKGINVPMRAERAPLPASQLLPPLHLCQEPRNPSSAHKSIKRFIS